MEPTQRPPVDFCLRITNANGVRKKKIYGISRKSSKNAAPEPLLQLLVNHPSNGIPPWRVIRQSARPAAGIECRQDADRNISTCWVSELMHLRMTTEHPTRIRPDRPLKRRA